MRNWNRVSEGLGILRFPLAKFVALELSAAYGDDWWDAGVDPFLTDVERAEFVGCASNPEWLLDCLNVEICLRVIDCSWSKLFSAELPRRCYPWVIELEIACDDLAREDEVDCSDDEANRWIDTMQRLCGAVDDDPAEERAGKILALMNVDEASEAGGEPDEAAPSNTAPAEQEDAEAELAGKSEPAAEEGLPQTEDDLPADQAENVEQTSGVQIQDASTLLEEDEQTAEVYAVNPELGKNCSALYHHPSGRMDVLAGSYVRAGEKDTLPKSISKLRAELTASGDLVARDDQLYVLNKQVSLGSPTAAAEFVLGGYASGPRKWREFESGSTIGELFPERDCANTTKKTTNTMAKTPSASDKKNSSASRSKSSNQTSAAQTKGAASSAPAEKTVTVYIATHTPGRACEAVYYYPSGKTDVLKGSYVRIAEYDSLSKSVRELRAELVASGDLVAHNSRLYELKKQVSFSSPSAAASFALGASASGPKEWRDVQTDVSLEKLFPKRGSVSSAKENAKPAAKISTSSSRRTVPSASRTRNSPAEKSATTNPTSARGASSSGAGKNTTVKLYMDIPGCDKRAKAIFYPNSKWMDVLGGSFVRIATFDSLPRDIKERREKLLASGDLVVQDGQVYALKQVVSFSSPTAAAEFVLGTSASGPREWRDSRGVELGDLYPELFRRGRN